jgi:hypothetical protein
MQECCVCEYSSSDVVVRETLGTQLALMRMSQRQDPSHSQPAISRVSARSWGCAGGVGAAGDNRRMSSGEVCGRKIAVTAATMSSKRGREDAEGGAGSALVPSRLARSVVDKD